MSNPSCDSNATLLPCPFCGDEARCYPSDAFSEGGSFEFIVQCNSVDNHTLVNDYQTETEAIAAWNSRAERTCRNVHKEWSKTSFAGAETSFCCSECGAHYVDCESYYAGLADADGEQIRTNYCPNCGARVMGE